MHASASPNAQSVNVEFHGDRIVGVRTKQGAFVYLKPIVERMGLDWSAQLKRIKRDPVLREGMAVMATPLAIGDGNEAVFLKLDLLNGWLFKVSIRRVAVEQRARLTIYQRECYVVLARAFNRADPPPCKPLSLKEEMAALRRVREVRLTYGIRAAQRTWVTSGLPIVDGMVPPDQGEMMLTPPVGERH